MAVRRRRRLGRGILMASAAIAVALAALPWWWPLALHTIDGVTVGDWTTSGWSSVELRDVTYERPGLRVTAGSVRVPAFGRWPRPENTAFVVAQHVVITPLPVTHQEPAPPPSTRDIITSILRAWAPLRGWLPSAQAGDITIATGDRPVRLTDVTWDGTRLAANGAIPGRDERIQLALTRPDEATLQFVAEAPGREARIDTTWRVVDERVDVAGDAAWLDATARLAAHFGRTGLLPVNAVLDAPAVSVAASELGLPGYGPVRGSVHLRWDGNEFETDLKARAEPLLADGERPPLAVDLRARGGLDSVRVDSALVQLPGIEAKLTAPLAVSLPAGIPSAPAQFDLKVDLARVPHVSAEGTVTGHIAIVAGATTAPAAEFVLAGAGVRWRNVEIAAIDVAGTWRPEVLNLTRCDVILADDAAVHASAILDLAQSRFTSATLSGKLTAAAVRPWLPGLPDFGELAIDAHAEGAFAQPSHGGTMTWKGLAGVPGGAVDGEVHWQGDGLAAVRVDGTVHSESGIAVPVAAQIKQEGGSYLVDLTRLAWEDAQGEWWHLAHSTQVRYTAPAVLAVEHLELVGGETNLQLAAELQLPASGHVSLAGRNLDGARVAALVPGAAANARLDSVSLAAMWDHGPVQGTGAVRATYTPDPTTAFSIDTEFRTEPEAHGGITFGSVRVLDPAGVVLAGDGHLPLVIAGGAEGFTFNLPRDGEVGLKLTSTPNPQFWATVTRLTAWQIKAPAVQAELSGTLGAPRGHITFATASVQPPPGIAGAVELPRIGDVKLVVTADDDGIALTEGIFTLEDNWVSLKGHASWDAWRHAREVGAEAWRDVEFSFAADRMPMGLASRAVPTLLAPEGDVSFAMKHRPDRGFSGFLWLAGAALRPLPPLGTVRDIRGRVELDGYDVQLPELGALIGGRPITITGRANVVRTDRPVFDVHLTSARVPLVRQPGLVLRAGVDVTVAQTADQPAHISGSVDLGQSVFVSDLVSLLPTSGAVTTPEQRPPYFSVRERPFAEWTLDVAVHGDDFLRIENPFFKGRISADFQLGGTLAEPRAIGRVWSDHGSIIFPFGTLRVDQLEVALSAQNPYVPALLATAGTRLYGYDVRLEASGSAADPRLLFSSDPPLTSQQVFLLLTTGEIPDTAHTFSTSERAQRLALFVGRNLASSLGLGSGPGDSDRLVIRSGEDFSREGGETLYVQYNLDGNWSVVAEKDRFDAYNGGIKFRLIDR